MYRSYLLATVAALACATPQTARSADSGKIETVIVTASPIAGNADRFATIVAQIDREQILLGGGANLADALANTPGVSGSSFAPNGASRPIIRGFDANRVRLMEDGVGSFDVSDVGPDHGVPIDPLAAQRIEVVRGAATLRYGSQAIGGVVNALNNRVPLSLSEPPFSAEATASYGSDADVKQASLMADGQFDQFAFHADVFGRRAGNYDTPLGVQANSFFKGDGGSVGASYFFGDASRTGLAVIHYDAQYGIPSDTTYIDMIQTKVLSRSSLAIGDGLLKTINVDAGYASYRHNEVDPETGDIESTFKDNEIDMRGEALLGPIGPLASSAVGIQFQNRYFSALGGGNDYLAPTKTRTGAIFAFTEVPIIGKLQLQAGARIENVHVQGTPNTGVFTERDFSPISGSVGVLFDLNDAWKFGLTASSTARAPGQTELFARGPHDGPLTFETGDPTLKMERANSIEGTVRARLEEVQFEGSLWSSWFTNYIYGEVGPGPCDETGCGLGHAPDLTELNYKQQGARFWGVEGKATVPLWHPSSGSLEADFLGDLVRATFNDGTNVPRIPAYRIGGGLSWSSERVDAGVLAIYVGPQNDFGIGGSPTASYVEVDAQVAWRPFASHPDTEFALVGHNLADEVERNAAAFNKDIIALPGRDIRIVLRTKL